MTCEYELWASSSDLDPVTTNFCKTLKKLLVKIICKNCYLNTHAGFEYQIYNVRVGKP